MKLTFLLFFLIESIFKKKNIEVLLFHKIERETVAK
jgi:hypothetical protein